MKPSEYVGVYLNLTVWLDGDSTTTIQIKNYLQSGMGQRSTNAVSKQGTLFSAICKELGTRGSVPPSTFSVGDYDFFSLSVQRTFMGKGSPQEIQDTLWLCSRYGMVNSGTLQSFCDDNLGVDCGGFVANLWGLGYPDGGRAVWGSTGIKPRGFWELNRSMRRKKADDIAIGDAIIFFKHMLGDNTDLASTDPAKGGEAFHIGTVADRNIYGSTIDLTIAESSGAQASSGGSGVNVRSTTLPLKTAAGLVYADPGSDQRMYFVSKAGNLTSYMPLSDS